MSITIHFLLTVVGIGKQLCIAQLRTIKLPINNSHKTGPVQAGDQNPPYVHVAIKTDPV